MVAIDREYDAASACLLLADNIRTVRRCLTETAAGVHWCTALAAVLSRARGWTYWPRSLRRRSLLMVMGLLIQSDSSLDCPARMQWVFFL